MITVDVPREWLLNANQRMHWRAKALKTSSLRGAGRIDAHYAKKWIHVTPFPGRMACTVEVQWPDRRRRDVHNLMPTVKPIIDGFVDARILQDDSDQYLVGPDLRVSETLCDKRFACSLIFTFEPVT